MVVVRRMGLTNRLVCALYVDYMMAGSNERRVPLATCFKICGIFGAAAGCIQLC